MDLNSQRPRGFGASRITVSEIEAWCRVHGIRDQSMLERIYFGVRVMDECCFTFATRKGTTKREASDD